MTDKNNAEEQHRPQAHLFKRLAAMLYDCFLVFAVMFIAVMIPTLIIDKSPASVDNGTVIHEINPLFEGVGFQLYLVSIIVIFFCLFWRKNGQTLGMQAWRLKIVSNDNQRLTIKQCLIRIFGAALSAGLFGIGYWWALFNEDRLCWHDRWSQSHVIQLPKKK